MSDLHESEVHIGDRFQLGKARVEISQPRTPCRVLLARLGNPAAKQLMLDQARTGFYLRVLEEGQVQSGDELRRLKPDSDRLTVAFAVQVYHQNNPAPGDLARCRKHPALSADWKQALAKKN